MAAVCLSGIRLSPRPLGPSPELPPNLRTNASEPPVTPFLPSVAADAKGAESAATWRRSSFDGPRRTSHDGPRRGSAEFKRRGSLDLPSKTTAWVPAATGYHEEMQGGGGGAAAGGGGHGSGAHVPTTVDEGNEGEGEAGTPRSRAQAQSSSRSLVGNVASWVLGAFGGKKPSEPNLEQNGEAARRAEQLLRRCAHLQPSWSRRVLWPAFVLTCPTARVSASRCRRVSKDGTPAS